jgi:transcriptional regulator with GAF, ATPase, and Fis domain
MQEFCPAKLVGIGGVLSGRVFPLEARTATFGRDTSNTIGVPDAALSRVHCVFSCDGDGWEVRDVGSSNGTFVNGQKIDCRALDEGDRISAGGCVLVFIRDSAAAQSSVPFDENAALLPTARLSLDDVAYLKAPDAPLHGSLEQQLQALLAISAAVHDVRDEGSLARELLDQLFKALPAKGGAVVRSGLGDSLEVQVARPDAGPAAVQVHTDTVRRAIGEGAGILCATAGAGATSAREIDVSTSVLAVPLSHAGQTLGALYLASDATTPFTEEHLQFATAVARIAATAVDNIRQRTALERETDRLHADLHLTRSIVGTSRTIRDIETFIGKVAKADATVLITGETGTGKELAAHAIHLRSKRARRPFVAINCAALAESLLESELFGHERGAFTSAVGLKKGRLELADGGTVFLDEVAELAPGIQSKLLRVLQHRQFERIGGTRSISIDVRVLAATNRDLEASVASGAFRSDLFYRLNVIRLHLPSLRQRREDIPALAEHFLAIYARKAGRTVTSISPRAMQCLVEHDWPGNVRELENAIERSCVLGTTEQILPEDLPEAMLEAAMPQPAGNFADLHASVSDAKRQAIIAAFRRAGCNYTETARLLGVHPNYLHRLIRHLNVKSVLENLED